MTDTGFVSPGTTANIDNAGGGDFADTDNVKLQNDTYANIDLPSAVMSDWIRVTNFGFDIPLDATLNGIEVQVDDYGENGNLDDMEARLVLDGVIKGDNQALDASIGSEDLDTYRVYGAVDNLWNAGLTVANVNDALFGFQIYYDNDHGTQNRNCYVDHIQIRITYTPVGGATTVRRAIGRGIGIGIMR